MFKEFKEFAARGNVVDLAVGAPSDGDGGPTRGAAWIVFLNATGAVQGSQKISDTAGTFTGVLDDGDMFGSSVAKLTDLDGDGITALAVGAIADDLRTVDRQIALEEGLRQVRLQAEGLPHVSEALHGLIDAPDVAWRAYAAGLLAQALGEADS